MTKTGSMYMSKIDRRLLWDVETELNNKVDWKNKAVAKDLANKQKEYDAISGCAEDEMRFMIKFYKSQIKKGRVKPKYLRGK